MKKYVLVFAQLHLLSHLPAMFELISLGSALWLLENEDTYRGLKSKLLKGSKEVDTNVKVLDEPTYVLMITAGVLLWIQAVVFSVVAYKVIRNRSSDGLFVRILSKAVYVGIGMYIIASFLMLAACVRFGSVFPMEKIETAFYINMATFCYIWLIVLIFICDHIFKGKRDKNVFSTLVCGLREINEDNVLI